MATFLSDQLTKKRTQIKAGDPLTPGELEGRVRVAHFSWTGDAASGDFVQLADIPGDARVLSGRLDHTDFGTTVTLDIGDGTTENKFLSAQDVATAAAVVDFANTAALGGLLVEAGAAAGFVLTAKFEGAGNPASGTLQGYLMYVVD